jgi:RNA polymerase sigma-70 factor (ECF subfamily)
VADSGLDTDELLDRTAAGNRTAREQLLGRHRDKLRRMVAVRLGRRLAARVDPSDVVQEALAEADRRLVAFARERPMPYYLWLRRLAWARLEKLRRRHTAGRRDIFREEPAALADESARALAERVLASDTGPSTAAGRGELQRRVRDALYRLASVDREVLVLRFLEQLSTAETAAVLGINPGAVKVRLFRALERLRRCLGGQRREDVS